ncbi:MAG: hypothetical protein ACU0FH_14975 [Heliomarina sp.]|uniref:hypothetical protein n=1 Tax=Heliomarina sp. TaxID=2917556 RepID=UPI00405889A6
MLALAISGPTNAATWLCKGEDGAGFRWTEQEKGWRPQTFTADDTFIIRPFKDTDVAPQNLCQDRPSLYLALELGDDEPVAYWWYDLEKAEGTQSLVGRYVLQFFENTNELLVTSIWYPVSRDESERAENTPNFCYR